MKAISLWQPWASLVALGVKTIETRSWQTPHRGSLAIHAAKRPVREDDFALGDPDFDGVLHQHGLCIGDLPRGVVLAVCELVDCVPTIEDDTGPRTIVPHFSVSPKAYGWLFPGVMPELGWYEKGDEPVDRSDQLDFGDFSPGRFAWLLGNILPLKPPVPARGYQQLWEWTPS